MTKTIDASYIVRVLTEDGQLYSDNTTATGQALVECDHGESAWVEFETYLDLLTDPGAVDVDGLTVQLIAGDNVIAEHRVQVTR